MTSPYDLRGGLVRGRRTGGDRRRLRMSSERYVWLDQTIHHFCAQTRALKSLSSSSRSTQSYRGRGVLLQPAPPEQALGRRQPAAEGGVELGRIARTAGRIDKV